MSDPKRSARAEEARAEEPEERPEAEPTKRAAEEPRAETVYSADDLILYARNGFGVSPAAMAGALKDANLTEATRPQAQAVVKAFLEKEA